MKKIQPKIIGFALAILYMVSIGSIAVCNTFGDGAVGVDLTPVGPGG